MRQSLGFAHAAWDGVIAEAFTWRGSFMLGIVIGAMIARLIWRT